jgi:hypothetical protein
VTRLLNSREARSSGRVRAAHRVHVRLKRWTRHRVGVWPAPPPRSRRVRTWLCVTSSIDIDDTADCAKRLLDRHLGIVRCGLAIVSSSMLTLL